MGVDEHGEVTGLVAVKRFMPGIFRQPHHEGLLDRAGISSDVANARPYFSLTDENRGRLAERWGFAKRQLEGEGLVIPRYRPHGEEGAPQIRHDAPRRGREGGSCKYDSPPSSGGIIDVHPLARERVIDASHPLWVPESVKGADALVSRGYAAVGFQGCWGWCLNGSLSPDWDRVPLEGREIYVCFDSDICDPEKRGPASPRAALYRLTQLLRARGADVLVAVIPQPGDEKIGIDDYLAGLRDDGADRVDDFEVSRRKASRTAVEVAR
jgi:hypothetical protein